MQLLTVSNKAIPTDAVISAYAGGCFIGHDDAFSDTYSASVDSR